MLLLPTVGLLLPMELLVSRRVEPSLLLGLGVMPRLWDFLRFNLYSVYKLSFRFGL
jgi:hypothetical protein